MRLWRMENVVEAHFAQIKASQRPEPGEEPDEVSDWQPTENEPF